DAALRFSGRTAQTAIGAEQGDIAEVGILQQQFAKLDAALLLACGRHGHDRAQQVSGAIDDAFFAPENVLALANRARNELVAVVLIADIGIGERYEGDRKKNEAEERQEAYAKRFQF